MYNIVYIVVLALCTCISAVSHGTTKGFASVPGEFIDQQTVSATAHLSFPANLGFTLTIDVVPPEGTGYTAQLTLNPDSDVNQTCQYSHSYGSFNLKSQRFAYKRKDAPECRKDWAGYACLNRVKECAGDYDCDSPPYHETLVEDGMCLTGYDAKYRNHATNDGHTVSYGYTVLPKSPALYFDAYKCGRLTRSYTFTYEVFNAAGEVASSTTFGLGETVGTYETEDFTATLDLTSLQFSGILDTILVTHGDEEGVMNVKTGLTNFETVEKTLKHIGYKTDGLSGPIACIGQTMICNVNSESCNLPMTTTVQPENFDVQYLDLSDKTGCVHRSSRPTRVDQKILRDKFALGYPTCTSGKGCTEFTTSMPQDITVQSHNCPKDIITLDVQMKGPGSVVVDAVTIPASDISNAYATGRWGINGASICMTSAKPGSLLMKADNLDARVYAPVLTFPEAGEMCTPGAIPTPLSNKLYLQSGDSIKLDLSRLEGPGEYENGGEAGDINEDHKVGGMHIAISFFAGFLGFILFIVIIIMCCKCLTARRS